jgi:hypothetical protein
VIATAASIEGLKPFAMVSQTPCWSRSGKTRSIETLRETALSLVQQLAQLKASSAWMASRASESENAKLEMLAELIKQKNVDKEKS